MNFKQYWAVDIIEVIVINEYYLYMKINYFKIPCSHSFSDVLLWKYYVTLYSVHLHMCSDVGSYFSIRYSSDARVQVFKFDRMCRRQQLRIDNFVYDASIEIGLDITAQRFRSEQEIPFGNYLVAWITNQKGVRLMLYLINVLKCSNLRIWK